MAGKAKKTTEIIKKYLELYPDLKDYTIAHKIYKDNKHLFDNPANVRQAVMYYRGHQGDRHRNGLSDTRFVKPLTHDTRRSFEELKSHAPRLKVFNLPTGIREILFLTDIHYPYQDNDALLAAIEYGVEHNVDCIWLNGDILDMFQASAHEQLPDKLTLREEFEYGRSFIAKLRKAFPKANIYWKEGNHECRMRRYLARNAERIFDNPEFELPIILRLAEHGIVWIPNTTVVRFGHLNVIHGNEFKGGGGVNPARTLFLRAKDNLIAGDKHKSGENNEGTMNGKLITTWSVGCLCDLNPEYMPFAHTTWNHGFAHITMKKDGMFKVRNFRIKDGEIL